jgi:hypothetical protein
MASQIEEVVVKYIKRIQQKQNLPRVSYGRGLLRVDGGPNRLFFANPFGGHALAILHQRKTT